jgi:hypothetical protein
MYVIHFKACSTSMNNSTRTTSGRVEKKFQYINLNNYVHAYFVLFFGLSFKIFFLIPQVGR